MRPAKRILLSSATIFECFKFTFAFFLNVPKPDTVLISVPLDQLKNIQWLENPNYMQSTCGMFGAYDTETVEKVVGRWYTVYMSNIPSDTDDCSQFTNVRSPCGCIGIDFTISMEFGIISFVMFSTNTIQKSVTYEFGTASFIGNRQLNMNQITLRSFVVNSNATLSGIGSVIIPSGVIVDSDDFESYIILVFCKKNARKPIIMVLVKELPVTEKIKNIILKYLNNNNFDTLQLFEVYHKHCKYGRNIVGLDPNHF